MKKISYIIVSLFIIFISSSYSFANYNFSKNLNSISNELINKQNNSLENLKKIHLKVRTIEEKLDTWKIIIDNKSKQKYKKLAKQIVIKILEKEEKIKNNQKEISTILNTVFSDKIFEQEKDSKTSLEWQSKLKWQEIKNDNKKEIKTILSFIFKEETKKREKIVKKINPTKKDVKQIKTILSFIFNDKKVEQKKDSKIRLEWEENKIVNNFISEVKEKIEQIEILDKLVTEIFSDNLEKSL